MALGLGAAGGDLTTPLTVRAAGLDHGLVDGELRERLVQHLAGPLPSQRSGQVDGHVVARSKGGAQRVCASRRQARDGSWIHAGLPLHDGVSLDVDAASACSPGELGVLPRGDVHHGLAVVLDQLLQHDGPGGHVDAERQGFCSEDQFAGPAGESLFNDRFEGGQLPSMVGGDTRAESAPKILIPERLQVSDRQSADVSVSDLPEQGGLIAGRQVHPAGEQLLNGGIADGTAENEPDRGQ